MLIVFQHKIEIENVDHRYSTSANDCIMSYLPRSEKAIRYRHYKWLFSRLYNPYTTHRSKIPTKLFIYKKRRRQSVLYTPRKSRCSYCVYMYLKLKKFKLIKRKQYTWPGTLKHRNILWTIKQKNLRRTDSSGIQGVVYSRRKRVNEHGEYIHKVRQLIANMTASLKKQQNISNIMQELPYSKYILSQMEKDLQ